MNVTKNFQNNGRITPDKKKQNLSSAMLLSINKPSQKSNAIPTRDTLALHKPKPSKTQEREQKDEEK